MQKQTAISSVPVKKRKVRTPDPVTDEDYINLARGLVLSAWPKIIKCLIGKSIKGGYQQTKLLLELCGISNVQRKRSVENNQQQLSDVLLKGLQIYAKVIDSRDGNSEPEKQLVSQDDYEKHRKQ